jgi:hypothetical protein
MKYLVTFATAFAIIMGAALLWSLPVFLLWNWLMPIIFNLPKITWLQALGVNILAGLLFKPTSVKVNKD